MRREKENIISRLTLEQAAATSSISTRWTDLWKLYSGFFDFDGSAKLYELSEQLLIWYLKRRSDLNLKPPDDVEINTESEELINWVNQVLRSHKGATMERLRVHFDPSHLSAQEMDNWIQLASLKNVQWLELDFIHFKQPVTDAFPFRSRCRFQCLTYLSLTSLAISAETLESLLIDCPNLEELKVACSKPLQSFKFSSLSLKYLTLWFCGDHVEATFFSISIPNLLYFSYAHTAFESQLVLQDVPQLEYIYIDCHWFHIRSHLSQLRRLKLNMLPTKNGGHYPDNAPELPKLKEMDIRFCKINDDSFGRFVTYFEAAPLLENLTIELLKDVELTEAGWKMKEGQRYNNLKTVKFVGFGRTKDVEIIRYFLNCAPLLEKIIIDPWPPSIQGLRKQTSHRQSTQCLEEARNYVINLTTSIPFNVTVV